jgi:hypothetical protein
MPQQAVYPEDRNRLARPRDRATEEAEWAAPLPGPVLDGGNADVRQTVSLAQAAPDSWDSYHEAEQFLRHVGLTPTPDAVGQLVEVFVPCLTIMTERGYDPDGLTWRTAGRLGALADMRKKFFRLWERLWILGQRHDDSAYDLINYTGFCLRADKERWGEWGEPGPADPGAL